VKAPYGETPRVYGFLSHLPGLPTVKGILSVEGNVKAPYGGTPWVCVFLAIFPVSRPWKVSCPWKEM
jgi:hypothetical protein